MKKIILILMFGIMLGQIENKRNNSSILLSEKKFVLFDAKLMSNNNQSLSIEQYQKKQMKSAARWLFIGTTLQIVGSFIGSTDSHYLFNYHSHYSDLGAFVGDNHSHSVSVPLIAVGSAINLIGIWKMSKAWN